MSQRPWTMKQFKRDFPVDLPEEMWPHLLKICNAALNNGLTRDEVQDVLADLGQRHPDVLTWPEMRAAFEERILEVELRDSRFGEAD